MSMIDSIVFFHDGARRYADETGLFLKYYY